MWREPRNTRPSHPAIYATRVHWGHDPRDAGVPTFEAAVDKVIAIHSPTWKNPSRMAGQWRQTLRDYAHPRIGRKRVSEVATADVLAILKPIWSSKPATARAVHQRIGAVMKWTVAKGYRPDNPAGDAAALPRNGNAIRHHKALPHGEVAAALAKVRDSESHACVRLALEFMVLTATRSNEVRGAAWDEVEHDVWTIPADRMKAKREHRVPLSGRALEILEEARKLRGGGGIVASVETRRPNRSAEALAPDRLPVMSQPTLWGHASRVPGRGWRGAVPPLTPLARPPAERVLTADHRTVAAARVSPAWHLAALDATWLLHRGPLVAHHSAAPAAPGPPERHARCNRHQRRQHVEQDVHGVQDAPGQKPLDALVEDADQRRDCGCKQGWDGNTASQGHCDLATSRRSRTVVLGEWQTREGPRGCPWLVAVCEVRFRRTES